MGNLFDRLLADPAGTSPDALWALLLLVLVTPLAGAALTAVSGRAARRVAAYAAAGHLILVAGTCTLYAGVVQYETDRDTGGPDRLSFRPHAVPGDVGHSGDSGMYAHRTGWSLLSFGPAAPADGGAVPADVQFFVGLDGLGLPLVALTSLMTLFAVLLSWDTVTDRPAGYYAWLLVLEFALVGAFVSFDAVLFYAFFELTLVPAFFLIGRYGVGGNRRDAARKFVLYTLLGSLLTLVGVVGIALTNPVPRHPVSGKVIYWAPTQQAMVPGAAGGRYQMPTGDGVSFSIPILTQNVLMWDFAYEEAVRTADRRAAAGAGGTDPAEGRDARAAVKQRRAVQTVLFFLLVAGFVVKLPLVPFHTWLPAAYAEAPLPVAMLFTAVLAKLGAFGMIRVAVPLAPEPATTYGLPILGTLGAVGIVYAALCAYAQRDLKLLAAYSSISHLGFLAVGLFGLNREGLTGAVLHMVNHGLAAGGLFALLVFLRRRYGTTDVDAFGGLWTKYPVYTFFVFVICLAGVGLPGLNNFVSEMMMLAGLFDPRNVKVAGYGPAVASVAGILLSAWYVFTMLRRVFFGPLREPPAIDPVAGTDLGGRELVPAAGLAGLCLLLGLYPQPVVRVVQTDVSRVAALADIARHRVDPTMYPPEPAEEIEVPPAEPRPQPRRGGGRAAAPAPAE
jgi:NADH-quinone oxidoreductase subunit M